MGERRANRDRNKEAEVHRRADHLELRVLHVLAHHGVARVHLGCVRARRVSGKGVFIFLERRKGKLELYDFVCLSLLGRQRRSIDRDEK